MRDINLSEDNLAVRWQYVNQNLKDLSIITQDSIEQDIRYVISGALQRSIDKEFSDKLGAAWYERTEGRKDVRCGYYNRAFTTKFGRTEFKIPRARCTKIKYELFVHVPEKA